MGAICCHPSEVWPEGGNEKSTLAAKYFAHQCTHTHLHMLQSDSRSNAGQSNAGKIQRTYKSGNLLWRSMSPVKRSPPSMASAMKTTKRWSAWNTCRPGP